MQLILLFVIITVAAGVPQGYNYNPHGSNVQVVVSSPQSSESNHNSRVSHQHLNANSLHGLGAGPPNGYRYDKPSQSQITKNIYIHSAPEEPEEESRQVIMGAAQKHYKVIFIRAPVQKIPKLSIVPQRQEDRTLIYVLSKKTDVSDIQIAAANNPAAVSKPEVYFIKYKTPEEAINAQNQIQAHYDKLGGPTQVTDEGVSPVQSVIGSYNNNIGSELLSSSSLSNVALTAPHNAYLPTRQ